MSKKARDFTHLFTEPRNAVVVAAANNSDAAVAGDNAANTMAAIMGFSGFGASKLPGAVKGKPRVMYLSDMMENDAEESAAPEAASAPTAPLLDGAQSTAASSSDSDGSGDASDDSKQAPPEEDLATTGYGIPVSHEAVLAHGNKPVSCLTLDKGAARLASGSLDFRIRFWDFNGMNRHHLSFKTVEPCASHQIRSIEYSLAGTHILIASGKAQAKVIDREGLDVLECAKGDQYLVDLTKTQGHVSTVTCARWHPINPNLFLTVSEDSTLRIWDVNDKTKSKLVARTRSKLGQKMAITACAFSNDGKHIAVGCQDDGSIQLFSLTDKALRLAKQLWAAHEPGKAITSLVFSRDGTLLLSRATDGTLKAWDPRALKPVAAVANLPCCYHTTAVSFSPDERLVITGTSEPKDEVAAAAAAAAVVAVGSGSGGGAAGDVSSLVFLNADTLKIERKVGFSANGVISSLWSGKLNQIFVGLSDGNVKVLYNPSTSMRGVKLSVGKMAPRKDPLQDFVFEPEFVPVTKKKKTRRGEKPGFVEPEGHMAEGKRRAQMAKDPIYAHRPALPASVSGTISMQGRLSGTSTLGQHIARSTAYDRTRDEDPREAILKHAAAAERTPMWVAPAYATTQPVPVFDMEPDDDEPATKKAKFDPNLRQKF